ncbi:MAG: hypothetical protein MJY92_08225 [Bacteroidales bacterium]|nr:hypothetical protein [Bacteroidales bacterium]MCQ2186686.1 hypothetical protein [Bacteroidales bacterium]
MIKESVKNNELQEQEKYSAPSVKVINLTAENILCVSRGYPTEFQEYNDI